MLSGLFDYKTILDLQIGQGEEEMAFNLRNRNFLKLLDFTPAEIRFLLDLSVTLKKAKYK